MCLIKFALDLTCMVRCMLRVHIMHAGYSGPVSSSLQEAGECKLPFLPAVLICAGYRQPGGSND